ncbi:hypothetical protein CKO28_18780 [Rhodovibrio sodomensis]|uniref:Uncharacterized protein n=1 Tax=Rhodovibrio sodomensis TaxID=1088 RepID=A0ABS1DJZ6_9PROT|nr:hypothetical protein [Rhodovibrio sodomensis]MBK1670084.1 hypothetical protein [Rhodovibrio sodomensis]
MTETVEQILSRRVPGVKEAVVAEIGSVSPELEGASFACRVMSDGECGGEAMFRAVVETAAGKTFKLPASLTHLRGQAMVNTIRPATIAGRAPKLAEHVRRRVARSVPETTDQAVRDELSLCLTRALRHALEAGSDAELSEIADGARSMAR